ncbi:uncharacterized protein LOC107429600 [Ziziphus jujuba]|uniref:Uncharacterized protein LOC107429600 n=1 Tax=Ziziphus jujuba TaxID=326968 RepID=A0A6P4AL41_ZIZJJ|nr:uncharacterized protein LOC107429600 [Ziziphus jujuba]
MEFWNNMIFPVRRVWLALSSRVNYSPKSGGGLLKLRDDVQTCGYEDVQVMWEMLRRSETEVIDQPPKRKHRQFWRVFVWSSNHTSSTTTTTTTTTPHESSTFSKIRHD